MIPLALVLWGILTRAVALEFRHLAEARSRRFTDWAFGISSLTVTFFGGMCVGAVLQGFPLTSVPDEVPTYVGGALRFVSAFSIWTGIAAVIAVCLSGGLFVRARFESGEPIREARRAAGRTSSFYLVDRRRADHGRVERADLPLGLANNWTWKPLLLGLGACAGRGIVLDNTVCGSPPSSNRDFRALLWLDATIAIMMRVA